MKFADPSLTVPEPPSDDDRAAILARLADFNRSHVELGSSGPLAVLLEDAPGVTVGGLWATTLFQWLRIELLFVPEAMRGSSLGAAIMVEAESRAPARGGIGASLDTYSFQAHGFYEKLGYTLVGTIDDFPPGGARHFLQKRFPGSLGGRTRFDVGGTAYSACPAAQPLAQAHWKL